MNNIIHIHYQEENYENTDLMFGLLYRELVKIFTFIGAEIVALFFNCAIILLLLQMQWHIYLKEESSNTFLSVKHVNKKREWGRYDYKSNFYSFYCVLLRINSVLSSWLMYLNFIIFRGEKLYFTEENRKLCPGWRRVFVCGLILIIIAVALLLGVLAASKYCYSSLKL